MQPDETNSKYFTAINYVEISFIIQWRLPDCFIENQRRFSLKITTMSRPLEDYQKLFIGFIDGSISQYDYEDKIYQELALDSSGFDIQGIRIIYD